MARVQRALLRVLLRLVGLPRVLLGWWGCLGWSGSRRRARLLTSADQITDDEINAGRTAALRKILEERGRE